MKRTYYAATVEKNNLYASMTLSAGEGDNLLAVFGRIDGLKFVSACESRKRAEELAAYWNRCHKVNGAYLYGE